MTPNKLSDFLPVVTTPNKSSLYQQTLPWFDEFQKSRQSVAAPEVGIEMLYFDWLRTAYAYRRMLIQDLCLVAFDIAEVRACIMVRRNEVFRKGFDEWEPRFVVKCENCGKEFQTMAEHCDDCFQTEVQFQGYEDTNIVDENGVESIIKNPIYKTIYSKDDEGNKIPSKVKSPDLSQVRRFEDFKKIANSFGQSLEDVLRQAMEFCYISDDGYILRNKEYFFEDNRLTGSRTVEIRALHPALIEFDLNKDGLPKKSHWICLEHRDVVNDAPAPCLECGKETYPVMYVYNHRGKKIYLTETEIIHFCYDDETEVLTQSGWKYFKNVTYDDYVATLSSGGYLEYQKPNNIYQSDYDGQMYYLDSRSVNLKVTPNHRMYVRRDNKDYFETMPAINVLNRELEYKRDAVWRGEEKETFVIPGFTEKYMHIMFGRRGVEKTRTYTDFVLPMDLWLEFLGYWISEGSCHGNTQNIIAQQKIDGVNEKNKFAKWQKIQTCVQKVAEITNSSWSYNGRIFTILNKVLCTYLSKLGKSRYEHSKYIPQEFKQLSTRQLTILFDALMLGDGTHGKCGTAYASRSPKLQDDFQELCLKIGKVATLSKGGDGKYIQLYISDKRGTPKINQNSLQPNPKHSGGEKNPRWKDGKSLKEPQDSLVHYSGKVYCVTVPNSIVYVRRNGRGVWSGNSIASPSVIYGYCFEKDTEVLTNTGFKFIDTITKDDNIATLNKDNNTLEYQKPIALTKNFYNGKLINIENKNVSLSCTPNHRVYADRGNGWEKFESRELLNEKIVHFSRTSDWVGEEKDYFTLPEYITMRPRKSKPITLSLYQWATLLGCYVATGSHKVLFGGIAVKNKLRDYLNTCDVSFSENEFREGKTAFSLSNERLVESLKESVGTTVATRNLKYIKTLPIPAQRIVVNIALELSTDVLWSKFKFTGTYKELVYLSNSIDGIGREKELSETIILSGTSTTSEFKKYPEKNIPMDTWCEFLGYYLSEGSTSVVKKQHGYIVQIAQEKSDYLVAIQNCLDKLPFKWRRVKSGWLTSDVQLGNYLMSFGKSRDKYIPQDIKALSKRQLGILLSALEKGDGSRGYYYYTNSKQLCDDFQEIALKCGLSTKVSSRFKNNCYEINIQRSFRRNVRIDCVRDVTEKEFNDFVYCCQVPNDIIFIRRHGKTYWSCNSLLLSIMQKALTLSGMDRCIPEDTDILTKSGWKSAKDVIYDDEIATVSKDDVIEYQKPTYIHSYYHNGKMYELKTKNIDLFTTPRHRMLVRMPKDNEYSFKEAQDIEGQQTYYLRGGLKWSGKEEEYFILPSCDKYIEKNITMDIWLEFFGYWLSEGSVSGTFIKISQNAGDKKNKIWECLSKLPFKWNNYETSFVCSNKQLAEYLKQFGKAKDKFIPENIKQLSSRQLNILFIALMLGDGHKDKKYTTASSQLRNDVMEISLKIGKSVCFYPIKDKRGYKCDMISLSQYNSPVVNKTKKQDRLIDWEGQVYCVEVPNTSLIVRRNGKVVVTGNTLYRYYFERKTPTGIILTYTDDPQSLESARSKIESKMMEDPTYIPWVGVSQKTGRGRCVTKDSLIWTSEGLLTMEELYAGEHTSVETKVGMQKILDKVKFKHKPIVKVTLGQNIELKCTPNHPFWTKRGWVEASKLTNSDYVLTAFGRNSFPELSPKLPNCQSKYNCHQKEFVSINTLSPNFARLIGYYVAEGHISQDSKYINIAIGKNKAQIDDVIRLCADFNIDAHYYARENSVRISNELFTNWFKNVIDWKHNGAHLKEIPKVVRQGTKEEIIEFLVGYFGDGFIMKYLLKDSGNYKPIIGWTSLSEVLLRQVQQLLLNMGIKSRLTNKKYNYIKHHDKSINNCHFKYELLVEGAAAAKLANILSDKMLIYKDRWNWAKTYIPMQNGGGKALFSSSAWYEDTVGMWLKVRKFENVGIDDVYDLTVDNTHSYVATGLVVHNTDFVRLFHTLNEMDYLPVRAEIRERVAMMFGVPPLWQSDTAGMGGLGSQNRQLEMFSRVVESDQRLLNEKILPLLLYDFGITDWKTKVKTPEEKTEEARLALTTQRIQAANVLFTMGFDVELAENKGAKIEDINFTVSGKAKRPELPMVGMGGGMMSPGQPTVPLQEDEGETKPVVDSGAEVAEDVEGLMNKATNKKLPFGTRFDRAHGLHNATDKHENNPKDKFNDLQKEFNQYMMEDNPDKKEPDDKETTSYTETSI